MSAYNDDPWGMVKATIVTKAPIDLLPDLATAMLTLLLSMRSTARRMDLWHHLLRLSGLDPKAIFNKLYFCQSLMKIKQEQSFLCRKQIEVYHANSTSSYSSQRTTLVLMDRQWFDQASFGGIWSPLGTLQTEPATQATGNNAHSKQHIHWFRLDDQLLESLKQSCNRRASVMKPNASWPEEAVGRSAWLLHLQDRQTWPTFSQCWFHWVRTELETSCIQFLTK